MAAIVDNLPNEPLFHHLLNVLAANPSHVLLRDHIMGFEATCSMFLTDMLSLRRQMIKRLPLSMFDSQGRISPKRPYVLLLAPSHYDFIVAAFAALSCGAAWTSLACTLSEEQASYILDRSDAACMLVSPEFQSQALKIQQHHSTKGEGCDPILLIPIARNCTQLSPKAQAQAQIDPEMVMDPRSPGALIFSSGSTGPPKGIVRPRSIFYRAPDISPHAEAMLNFGPTSFGTVAMEMIWRVLEGARIEVIRDSPHEIWERLSGGGITELTTYPWVCAKLMRYFNEFIDSLPSEQRDRYIKGARQVRKFHVTGDFTWPTVMSFWRELLGFPLINEYGSSEMGSILMTTYESDPTLDRCIGKPLDGVQLKLSEGDHGDILVKSPSMFTHYVGNEDATQAAFDEDGFFQSGDVGRRVGDQYVLEGRASTDIFRHYEFWIHLKEIEARLDELPYVSEAYVVAVDFNCVRQIAFLARLKTPKAAIDLSKIRVDLQDRLHTRSLPTLLRFLQDHEDIPKLANGKLDRKSITQKFFRLSLDGPLPSNLEFWDEEAQEVNSPKRTQNPSDI